MQAAMSVEPELESSSISVSMVGRSVLLEGYVAGYVDREKATATAASIAGPENVHDRMRDADEMADTVRREPIGTFEYEKDSNGTRYHVTVHVLFGNEIADRYPESDVRERLCVPLFDAIKIVAKPQVRALLASLAQRCDDWHSAPDGQNSASENSSTIQSRKTRTRGESWRFCG
ncbi:BON domain-containing protein [Rhizobium lentis]|uniref:BON domain-containing protein n=1 Tax=Rhizobium lentis TaxID=1138194 RepID=UPI00287F8743|nr:BON domain-containing protein [Rhizobium lentis]